MPKLKRKSELQKVAEKRERAKRRKLDITALAGDHTCSTRDQEENPDEDSTRTVQNESKLKKAESMRSRRQDPNYRETEQVNDTESKRLRRTNPQIRTPEKTRNAESMKARRKDENTRKDEIERTRSKRIIHKSTYDRLLDKYMTKIRQAPTFICSCCGALCYEESTSIITKEELREKGCSEEFVTAVLHYNQDIHRLCCTCKSYVLRKDDKKLPRVALANGLDFPEIPDQLKVKHERALICVNI